jgi:hypothetical protein
MPIEQSVIDIHSHVGRLAATARIATRKRVRRGPVRTMGARAPPGSPPHNPSQVSDSQLSRARPSHHKRPASRANSRAPQSGSLRWFTECGQDEPQGPVGIRPRRNHLVCQRPYRADRRSRAGPHRVRSRWSALVECVLRRRLDSRISVDGQRDHATTLHWRCGRRAPQHHRFRRPSLDAAYRRIPRRDVRRAFDICGVLTGRRQPLDHRDDPLGCARSGLQRSCHATLLARASQRSRTVRSSASTVPHLLGDSLVVGSDREHQGEEDHAAVFVV